MTINTHEGKTMTAQKFVSFLAEEKKVQYPHVHLCFDDHSVSNWHAARDLFVEHKAKAVFYVDSFHLLTDKDLDMLSDLRSDGHVIGCHGKTHRDALSYARMYDVDRYIEDEILPAMEDMAGAGFKPTHFAFPLSRFDEELYRRVCPMFCYVRPGNESHYYQGDRMYFKPDRLKGSEDTREHRIRRGKLQGVLAGLADTAKAMKGISLVMHDIRPHADAPAHAGTHARLYVVREELSEILKTIKSTGFQYQTFEDVCEYGVDPFDKPEALP